MPLNRQAVVMARHGGPIGRSVLAERMGQAGASVAPAVDHMAERRLPGSTRRHVEETTAPVRDPGKRKARTGDLWAVLRDCKPLRRRWFAPYAYLQDLFTKLASGHLDRDIDALTPWA